MNQSKSIQSIKTLLLCIIGTLITSGSAYAQVDKSSELFKTLKAKDSILFKIGFDKCEIERSAQLMVDDLEFYHDKSGVTTSKEEFVSNMKNGICKPNNSQKVYRFLVEESLEVFPMYNNTKLYGALQKGKHFFSPSKSMTFEESDNYALFTHLWILEDSKWKLKRVISYNHVSKEVVKHITKVDLKKEILIQYTGLYKAPKTGEVSVTLSAGNLSLKAGEMIAKIIPVSQNTFKHPQAPLVFKFVKDSTGKVSEMIVEENGKMVETAIKQ
ncbi:MAG: nuclear transport factor 2 family protein [Winogradskyella sp.]|uniref:hypothetical protein n=1 Tax=Winogradskyella sp. TaxID=1883156 RepID=UPI000F3DCFE8|nr:hypothetical protein [Winogradskyella sp.]RNC84833.1 MAG: nuclear transport factor 2 family protein [Winogradskyella sp.]